MTSSSIRETYSLQWNIWLCFMPGIPDFFRDQAMQSRMVILGDFPLRVHWVSWSYSDPCTWRGQHVL